MVSAHNERRGQTTPDRDADAGSLTEDYVGLARYLAAAVARGDVPFDKATDELAASASDTERASLQHAAAAAEETPDDSLIARLLTRANATGP
jgi:hypothetical protein